MFVGEQCISAAFPLKWMVGKTLDEVFPELDKKEYTYKWLDERSEVIGT